jgi:molybdopterin biosynthesis enzyme
VSLSISISQVEDTVLLHDESGKERVRILKAVSKGQDIRPIGSDIRYKIIEINPTTSRLSDIQCVNTQIS